MWLGQLVTRHLGAYQSFFHWQASSIRQVCDSALIDISSTWQLLGPFQIGTREATWGADPLEYHGGFRALEYSHNATYPSSLAANATIGWSHLEITDFRCDNHSAEANLVVTFPTIDWDFQQAIYGWAALQYQAWARGSLYIHGTRSQRVVLYTDHVLEFWIDNQHYFGGDFNAYRRSPLVVTLEPGPHRLDVRLVRDVRAMGGIGRPTIDITIRVEITNPALHLASDKLLLPDLVDGKLAGTHGSMRVRNDDYEVYDIIGLRTSDNAYTVRLLESTQGRSIAPGQSRPITFELSCHSRCSNSIIIGMEYRKKRETETTILSSGPQSLKERAIVEPHKITYLHPGGITSYAVLRPPSRNATCRTDAGNPPILLQMHGAGLEADDPMVAHALDPLPDLCAFVVFPTGVTPWSGDDWHQWGFADVEAAIAFLPEWLGITQWEGPHPDLDHWLVSGHSNGGQGTWYALTHRPDNVFAAAPVSGYSSIQNYVPYHFWQPMDPSIQAIIDGSLNSYRHELLLPNADGINILQQHGSADDNVPPYHSRLMNQRLRHSNVNVSYAELAGKGHWFDGVMTTDVLSAFYQSQVQALPVGPAPMTSFSLIVANPGDTGPKHGFSILQLETPGRLGRLDVICSSSECAIKVSNVAVVRIASNDNIARLSIDGQDLVLTKDQPHTVFMAPDHEWQIAVGDSPGISDTGFNDNQLFPRSRRQSGPMDAILRTQGLFRIISGCPQARDTALQISRNLCQYFAADTLLLDGDGDVEQTRSNVVRVLLGSDIDQLPDQSQDFPITISDATVTIRDDRGRVRRYNSEGGLGTIFLRPLKDDNLELVVWGADEQGLAVAARLVPMLTGVGQPDFVIADKRMLWQGASGVLAMGFLDTYWNSSKNSYFT